MSKLVARAIRGTVRRAAQPEGKQPHQNWCRRRPDPGGRCDRARRLQARGVR